MASFNWLLWNQILLFEELSGGDTWKRICRGRSESVRGGASPGGGCLLQRLLEGANPGEKRDMGSEVMFFQESCRGGEMG